MAPADVLAVVAEQFNEVRRHLLVQLRRTAELQQQLDIQRKEIGELRRAVDLANGLMKQLLVSQT